jgi:4-amino-4-deoxy-L-arabinose transferase-like glycosyltransferase
MIGVTNQVSLFKPATYAVTNLPFHLLQSLSFLLLGATIFSVKLPAIILSIAVAISLFFLLRRWFRPNVAILSMLIMVATGQLIFLSQSFTPGILYVLYTTLILLFASLVVQRAKYQQLWKISLGITLGLSMFTPYFWYINLGLLAVALIHPHPRHFLISRRYRKSWQEYK